MKKNIQNCKWKCWCHDCSSRWFLVESVQSKKDVCSTPPPTLPAGLCSYHILHIMNADDRGNAVCVDLALSVNWASTLSEVLTVWINVLLCLFWFLKISSRPNFRSQLEVKVSVSWLLLHLRHRLICWMWGGGESEERRRNHLPWHRLLFVSSLIFISFHHSSTAPLSASSLKSWPSPFNSSHSPQPSL